MFREPHGVSPCLAEAPPGPARLTTGCSPAQGKDPVPGGLTEQVTGPVIRAGASQGGR